MSDDKTGSTKSVRPTAPVGNWRRWKFRTSIILMVLGAAAIIVFLVLNGLAKQYAGVGTALCVIACGGFLVWHAVHLFAEEDVIEEQTIGKEPDQTAPPRD